MPLSERKGMKDRYGMIISNERIVRILYYMMNHYNNERIVGIIKGERKLSNL